MTFADTIKSVLQKLTFSLPYSIKTCGNDETVYVLHRFTREEISIIMMCCYQVMKMIDHRAEIEPNIHITIIDGDKKGK